MRVPNLTLLEQQAPTSPLLSDACEAWRRSRIDVTDGTRTLHRVATRPRPAHPDRDQAPARNHRQRRRRRRRRARRRRRQARDDQKERDCLAMVLDHHHVDPNPARDTRVRLPQNASRTCRRRSPNTSSGSPSFCPPLRAAAAHPRQLRAARQRARDRPSRRPRRAPPSDPGALDRREERPLSAPRVSLPHDLFAALLATLPPREDRDLEAPLFADLDDAALRTAITRACKATGVPHFSPHGAAPPARLAALQAHRLARRGRHRPRRLASASPSDHYVYALTDYREVDRTIALARALA